MIAFKSYKIIVVMILEPSTGTPGGGDSRHLDLEGMIISRLHQASLVGVSAP